MKCIPVLFLSLVFTLLNASQLYASEIILGKCGSVNSAIAKLINYEPVEENEFLCILAQNGAKEIIIRTYNPKIEKFKGDTVEDTDFFYYDSALCEYRFEDQKEIRKDYIFVNKRSLDSSTKAQSSHQARKTFIFSSSRGNGGSELKITQRDNDFLIELTTEANARTCLFEGIAKGSMKKMIAISDYDPKAKVEISISGKKATMKGNREADKLCAEGVFIDDTMTMK